MVEVVATQVQTFRVRRSNGTEAVVVASDDRNTLEIYGRTADRKVWIKRNDMNAEMTQTAVISVIKGLERFDPQTTRTSQNMSKLSSTTGLARPGTA